ncbi:MAG: hypothetical protein GX639_04820 [Fibrobacter sp.]|nr:hypothetical protein [Fibrobacter sp.]
MTDDFKKKISLFCNVPPVCVFENRTLKSVYDVPLVLDKKGFADVICEKFGFSRKEFALSEWNELSRNFSCPKDTTTIALVGKYVGLRDAYLSVVESFTHVAAANHTRIDIKWVEVNDMAAETADNLPGRNY